MKALVALNDTAWLVDDFALWIKSDGFGMRDWGATFEALRGDWFDDVVVMRAQTCGELWSGECRHESVSTLSNGVFRHSFVGAGPMMSEGAGQTHER